MASILDRYGIKEVADFTFYDIDSATGKPSKPVLYLDTLKVSTVEQTADTVESKGGKGNVTLLSWDTNKEINVTLEDALFSAKSLAIMFGNGKLKTYSGNTAYIMRTETFATANVKGTTTETTIVDVAKNWGWSQYYEGPTGKLLDKINPKFYDAEGHLLTKDGEYTLAASTTYFCTYDLEVEGSVVEVGANTFPGTYYCVGDTFARNSKSGKDEFFQFIIPKAKVQSGNTITLQSDGDPSTFNMSLKVMKPDDGIMMKLVKYDTTGADHSEEASSTATLDHNHVLDVEVETVAISGTGAESKVSKTVTGATTAVSSNPSVATVSTPASGAFDITGVAAGTCTVTAGDSHGQLKKFTVTVTAG